MFSMSIQWHTSHLENVHIDWIACTQFIIYIHVHSYMKASHVMQTLEICKRHS